jgi:predicted metal-dependent hydrolase
MVQQLSHIISCIKTSEIIVDSDKVTIRTPLNKSLSDIKRIISGKASWILKKQRVYKETIPQITKPTYEEGSTLPYLGRNYPLRIIKNQSEYNIQFVDRGSSVSSKYSSTKIKRIYEDWLVEKAKSVFKHKERKIGNNLATRIIAEDRE